MDFCMQKIKFHTNIHHKTDGLFVDKLLPTQEGAHTDTRLTYSVQ